VVQAEIGRGHRAILPDADRSRRDRVPGVEQAVRPGGETVFSRRR
jgi:hypothetical protein